MVDIFKFLNLLRRMSWFNNSNNRLVNTESCTCKFEPTPWHVSLSKKLSWLLQLTQLLKGTSIARELICDRPASYPGGVLYSHPLGLRKPSISTGLMSLKAWKGFNFNNLLRTTLALDMTRSMISWILRSASDIWLQRPIIMQSLLTWSHSSAHIEIYMTIE